LLTRERGGVGAGAKSYDRKNTLSSINYSIRNRHKERLRKRDNLLTRERGRVGAGAKSYDRKNSLSSMNYSIHSAVSPPVI
jgi:hypothetical protein